MDRKFCPTATTSLHKGIARDPTLHLGGYSQKQWMNYLSNLTFHINKSIIYPLLYRSSILSIISYKFSEKNVCLQIQEHVCKQASKQGSLEFVINIHEFHKPDDVTKFSVVSKLC